MPLRSTNPRHDVYFNAPAVLLDTCAITWVAKHDESLQVFDRLLTAYRLLVPTPVLYELAFGPPDLAHANEILIRKRLFKHDQQVDIRQYGIAREKGQIQAGGFYILNPGFMEWWSARERLLKYVSVAGASHRASKREHSLDALIHSCARNSFAPVCTLNESDFSKMNRAGATSAHDGIVPFFSPARVLEAISSEVYFEDET